MHLMRFTKDKILLSNILIVLSLFPILFLNSNTMLFSGYKYSLIILLSSIILIITTSFLIAPKITNPFQNFYFNILYFHIIVYSVTSVILLLNYKKALFLILIAVVLSRLLICNLETIKWFLIKYLKIVITIFFVNIIIGLYLTSYIQIYDLKGQEVYQFIERYLNTFFGGSFSSYLRPFVNYDAPIRGMFSNPDFIYPRMTGHLSIASLINAYLLLPLGLCLLYGVKSKIILISCFFIIIMTVSSTCYITLLCSAFIYFSFNLIKKTGPLIFVGSTITILLVIFYVVDDSISTAESWWLVEWARENNNHFIRLSSGFSRLFIIKQQMSMFVDNFYSGFDVHGSTLSNREFKSTNIGNFTLGSFLITSGVRSGILGFLSCLLIYYFIISNLLKIKPSDKFQRYGISLLLSFSFMAFTFQDYGFSSYAGLVLIGIIFRFFVKNKNNQVRT